MRIAQKTLLSLLCSLLLVGGGAALVLRGSEGVYPLHTAEVLLCLVAFITLFLFCFLLFSLRQDPVGVVQKRLKQLYLTLMDQLYDLKGDMDWSRWALELERRREEVKDQVKRGLKSLTAHQDKEIDILINKFWNEFISLIRGSKESDIDEEKLSLILNRISQDRFPRGASPVKKNTKPQGGLLKATMIRMAQAEAQDENLFIVERGGVHYVSPKALSTDTQSDLPLNREFKDLVDSVL